MGKKVLILATSSKTRGGITSVVQAHQKGEQWKEYGCKWIETHIDKSLFLKLWYSFTAFVKFLFFIPFYGLVHIHLSEPASALRKYPFLVIAKLLRKKTVLHFHAFSPETTLQSKYQFLYRNMFSQADVVIALSSFWKSEIAKITNDSHKIKVLFNPCPDTVVNTVSKENVILFAGTVNKRKGYDVLLKGFAQVAHQFPNWRVEIAGNGHIDEAKQIAKELGIENQVVFLGWVRGDKKVAMYNRAKVFCLPSYAEGFPMAVLDAWAYKLPVICTPVGGLPEIVVDGDNALVFPCGNDHILGEKLHQIISDENLQIRISKESYYLAKNVFSQKVINAQLADIYSQILN